MIVDRLSGGIPALIGQDANGKAKLKIDCQDNTISLMVSATQKGQVHLQKSIKLQPRATTLCDVTLSDREQVSNGE